MNRFKSYKDLCRYATEGRDFIIETRFRDSVLAVMAPHGGSIEPGTDAIAAAISGGDYSYYAFKGVRTRYNAELHIASERFDEPRALALARQVRTIVTVHGCRGQRAEVYVGGLDKDLKIAVIKSLQASGFAAAGAPRASLLGIHRSNLCNRGQSGKGVQLELTEQLRRQLIKCGTVLSSGNDGFILFAASVRRALVEFTQGGIKA